MEKIKLLTKDLAMFYYFVNYFPGFKQRNDGCYKERRTFISQLNPSDYFQDDNDDNEDDNENEEEYTFEETNKIVKKEYVKENIFCTMSCIIP